MLKKRKEFRELLKKWKKETSHFSVYALQVEHPNYQQIISFGNELFPLILEVLEEDPYNIFLLGQILLTFTEDDSLKIKIDDRPTKDKIAKELPIWREISYLGRRKRVVRIHYQGEINERGCYCVPAFYF